MFSLGFPDFGAQGQHMDFGFCSPGGNPDLSMPVLETCILVVYAELHSVVQVLLGLEKQWLLFGWLEHQAWTLRS